jgi:hypothetical protein
MGIGEGGGKDQIDADDLVRRHVAVQMRPISPPAMAGGGRKISAKTAATTASPELVRVRVRTRARERGRE